MLLNSLCCRRRLERSSADGSFIQTSFENLRPLHDLVHSAVEGAEEIHLRPELDQERAVDDGGLRLPERWYPYCQQGYRGHARG